MPPNQEMRLQGHDLAPPRPGMVRVTYYSTPSGIEYSLGKSWLNNVYGMVPWWFKTDREGYTGHEAVGPVVAALRRYGFHPQVKGVTIYIPRRERDYGDVKVL